MNVWVWIAAVRIAYGALPTSFGAYLEAVIGPNLSLVGGTYCYYFPVDGTCATRANIKIATGTDPGEDVSTWIDSGNLTPAICNKLANIEESYLEEMQKVLMGTPNFKTDTATGFQTLTPWAIKYFLIGYNLWDIANGNDLSGYRPLLVYLKDADMSKVRCEQSGTNVVISLLSSTAAGISLDKVSTDSDCYKSLLDAAYPGFCNVLCSWTPDSWRA